MLDEFRSKLPAADGLVIRAAIKERMKRAEKCTQKISSLPAYKPRGRKRTDSAYRNRVGKRADALRKVCDIHLHVIYTCMHVHVNTHIYYYH